MKKSQWEDAVSSFNLISICDDMFPESQLIPWVFNHEESRSDGSNKPAGFGLPGGGMEEGDFESPETAAQGELRKETGLGVEYSSTRELFCVYRVIVTGPDNKRFSREVPVGQWPNVSLNPGQRGRRERFYVFTARPKWRGSKLQELFYEYRDLFVPGEGIRIYFDEVPEARTRGLGIEEALPNERGEVEIGGIALITPESIRRLASTESRKDREGFYKSHLDLALRAMEELKL